MASRNNVNDDDEELGAYIYQTSHTAKLFREKKAAVEALESPPSSHQTQRKSPRLLATKSKQQDIPTAVVPEKSTSNINTSIEQRAKRKKRISSAGRGIRCTPICLQQNKGCRYRYSGGQKRKLCSFDGCTNIDKKGGVCVKHGAWLS